MPRTIRAKCRECPLSNKCPKAVSGAAGRVSEEWCLEQLQEYWDVQVAKGKKDAGQT